MTMHPERSTDFMPARSRPGLSGHRPARSAEKEDVPDEGLDLKAIKSARDIMRKDAGLNGDLIRLPQLSWLLLPARVQ